jgi:hypothetical protein
MRSSVCGSSSDPTDALLNEWDALAGEKDGEELPPRPAKKMTNGSYFTGATATRV